MATAIEIERLQQQGAPALCTAVDLFKCFDQCNRWAIYAVLCHSGFPKQVLLPYMQFLESVQVCGSFAGGACVDFSSRQASIPQGCPFSMSVLACMTTVAI
eukprot:12976291-Alexandrium_andersonii.AAC.1